MARRPVQPRKAWGQVAGDEARHVVRRACANVFRDCLLSSPLCTAGTPGFPVAFLTYEKNFDEGSTLISMGGPQAHGHRD